ncbi:MAG: BON domain-containing protein [Deltaproteobacteria bacterium]
MPLHVWSRGFVAIAAVAVWAGVVGEARAQQTGLFGSSGPMSGGNGMSTGSMGSGSMGATMGSSTSGMQSTAFPSTAFPAPGATGATGFGQNAMGNTALGGTAGTGAMGGQRQGFVGQANTRFVGNQQAMQGQTGQNQFNNRQGQNAGARRQGQNANQNNQTAGTQSQRSIRPQLIVAFDRPKGIAERSTAALAKRFQKLSDRKGFEGITIDADGNKLVLRGEVDSAQTSRLATMLARMEPGVKSVKNELTVRESAPAAVE